MAQYIIGDVQGCYSALQRLLEVIDYQPQHDQLLFVGDLVNRGQENCNTLRLLISLSNIQVVLGNHDLHLLAVYYKAQTTTAHDTLHDILTAPDCDELIHWLQQQPLFHYDENNSFCMVHAGIPPQWDIKTAQQLAAEVTHCLQSAQAIDFLKNRYGNEPAEWSNTLSGWPRLRYITNALTRMRFCDKTGKLDLNNKSAHSEIPQQQAWFHWRQQKSEPDIYFGHWASLDCQSTTPHCHAIDSGCVWGNTLTAINPATQQRFAVSHESST